MKGRARAGTGLLDRVIIHQYVDFFDIGKLLRIETAQALRISRGVP
jgi:hypothetical protein